MSSDLEKRIDELKSELTGYKLKNKMLSQEILSLKQELFQSRQESNTDNLQNQTVLAHEINQPLTAIATYSRSCLLLIANQSMDQNIRKRLMKPLEKIAAQAGLAGEIIHNMNNLMHAGSSCLEETNINLLIKDTLTVLNNEMLNAQLTIKLDLMDNPPIILTNKTHIMQVLLNLARNSIEALNTTPEPELTIKTKHSEGFIQVHVRDNGTGIPPKLRKKIRTNYFTTKPNGTGIGLGICSTLIEGLGGELSLQDDEKQGTWFVFTLPVNIKTK